MTHSFPVRIYYEDTDAAGIVYHANYLKFAERARAEVLRLSGIEQSELMREHTIAFVIRRCACEFLKPRPCSMTSWTNRRRFWLDDINKVSMHMHHNHHAAGAKTLVTFEVKIAMVATNGKLATVAGIGAWGDIEKVFDKRCFDDSMLR